MVYHPERLPKASLTEAVCADKDGYIAGIVCDEVGICSLMLGGGRETKEDVIDLSVGIVFRKKKGDAVRQGEPIATLHANDAGKLAAAKERLTRAVNIEEKPVAKTALIKQVITEA